ncbi:MAG TPA: EscU/YscU/HrcU family type III secretion system export apparatus switch protein, partial [Terriglobales bacterium]|nr:EscU/YscU/HrcU family type III secretion system export apparatus switch protein [Terriglobales bacterium]
DDFKETEGNPLIKGRIRRLRRQTLRKRMLEDAKRASVVITNPNEFAVALEYKPAMAAPMVIAKGRNLLAQQIKQVARWHGIPMVENPPLAHALYRAAEIGQYVPPKLYRAVAAILAAIYRAEQRAQNSGVSRG